VSEGGELGGKKKLREVKSVAASTVLQLRLRTNHVDALAVDAWATLLAEKGVADWVADERVFCSGDDHLMTEEGKD
jgi:hypothetical protein